MGLTKQDGNTVYFGGEAQQRMQRTAHSLWPLLRDSPAYGTEGRMIGIDGMSEKDVGALAALARVQGATVSHYVPLEKEERYARSFQDAGLSTDRWDQFMGDKSCLDKSAEFVRNFTVPDEYRLEKIAPETTLSDYQNLAETALACGVLPPVSAVLEGKSMNAVCFILKTMDGTVAACAGAVMRNHPDSRFGNASWWGMLATHEVHRGQSLSLYLGAKATLYMHEKFGAEEFYTGVRKDNVVSRHVCQKLGVDESGYACLAILDPEFFSKGGYTK